jgi:hypothetical protein
LKISPAVLWEVVKMNTERRIFKRVPVEFKAHCIRNLQGASHEYFLSFAKDISLQGMRIASSRPVELGEHITLALEIPIYFIPLLLYGEAEWLTHKDGINNNVECGMRFFKMEPVDYKRLRNYLSSIDKEYLSPSYKEDIFKEESNILQMA